MQRLQNYLTAILIRQVVLRKAASTIQQFARNTGQRVTGLDGGPNAAAAVIATVDFALEYPIALPPIVQVCASLSLSECFPAPYHPSLASSLLHILVHDVSHQESMKTCSGSGCTHQWCLAV